MQLKFALVKTDDLYDNSLSNIYPAASRLISGYYWDYSARRNESPSEKLSSFKELDDWQESISSSTNNTIRPWSFWFRGAKVYFCSIEKLVYHYTRRTTLIKLDNKNIDYSLYSIILLEKDFSGFKIIKNKIKYVYDPETKNLNSIENYLGSRFV